MVKRTLKVLANPYSALDADGRAQGVVMREGIPDQYIAAYVDLEETAKLRKNIFRFTGDAVLVPMTAYYLRRLQARELLPADAETAKAAGLKDFESPDSAIEKQRSEAQSVFENNNGRVPAFAARTAAESP